MISCLGGSWLPTATSVSSSGLCGNKTGEDQNCLLAAALQLQFHWIGTVLAKLDVIKTEPTVVYLEPNCLYPCPVSTGQTTKSAPAKDRFGSKLRAFGALAAGLGLQPFGLEAGFLPQDLGAAA